MPPPVEAPSTVNPSMRALLKLGMGSPAGRSGPKPPLARVAFLAHTEMPAPSTAARAGSRPDEGQLLGREQVEGPRGPQLVDAGSSSR